MSDTANGFRQVRETLEANNQIITFEGVRHYIVGIEDYETSLATLTRLEAEQAEREAEAAAYREALIGIRDAALDNMEGEDGPMFTYYDDLACAADKPLSGFAGRGLLAERDRLREENEKLKKEADIMNVLAGQGADRIQELRDERDRLAARCKAMEGALRRGMEDRQCSQKCDGQHTDCPCWYCRAADVLKEGG